MDAKSAASPPRYRWFVLAVAWLAALVGFWNIIYLPMVFVPIAESLKLTAAQISSEMSVFLWFFGFGLIACGFLIERLGMKATAIVGIMLFVVHSAIYAFVPVFVAQLFARVLLGLGVGFIIPPLVAGVSMWFGGGKSAALASGSINSGAALGLAIGSVTIPYWSTIAGWQTAAEYLIVAGILALVLMAVTRLTPEPGEVPVVEAVAPPPGLVPEGKSINWAGLGAYAASFFLAFSGYFVAITFLVPYAQIVGGLSLKSAGNVALIQTLLIAVFTFVGGWVTLKTGRIWPVVLVSGLLGVFVVALGFSTSPLTISIFGALSGFPGPMLAFGAYTTAFVLFARPEKAGAAVGYGCGIGSFGGAVSTLIVGLLVDAIGPVAGFQSGFITFGLLEIVAGLMVLAPICRRVG